MGVDPKIGGFYPQNGWFINNGSKPYEQMDDLGGCFTTPLFLVQHPNDDLLRSIFSKFNWLRRIFFQLVVEVGCFNVFERQI